MDDRSIQRFIRECDMKDMVYALKNANKQITEISLCRYVHTIQAVLEASFFLQDRVLEIGFQ